MSWEDEEGDEGDPQEYAQASTKHSVPFLFRSKGAK